MINEIYSFHCNTTVMSGDAFKTLDATTVKIWLQTYNAKTALVLMQK